MATDLKTNVTDLNASDRELRLEENSALRGAEEALIDDRADVAGHHGLEAHMNRLMLLQMKRMQLNDDRNSLMWRAVWEDQEKKRRDDIEARRDERKKDLTRGNWLHAITFLIAIAAAWGSLKGCAWQENSATMHIKKETRNE